jgi:hypothetical protein
MAPGSPPCARFFHRCFGSHVEMSCDSQVDQKWVRLATEAIAMLLRAGMLSKLNAKRNTTGDERLKQAWEKQASSILALIVSPDLPKKEHRLIAGLLA